MQNTKTTNATYDWRARQAELNCIAYPNNIIVVCREHYESIVPRVRTVHVYRCPTCDKPAVVVPPEIRYNYKPTGTPKGKK
jgi:hypothetical protein